MLARRSSYLFQLPWLEKFISACQKIEADPNYQPYITNKELFNLVVDENGNARHSPRRSALAIQRSNIKASTATGDSLGMVYQIKIASKSCIGDDEYPVWNIDDSAVILVNKKGEYSFHSRENAEKGNFNSPLTHLSIDRFLNRTCLHYPEEQQKTKIFNFV
jgi:hypothetical protein